MGKGVVGRKGKRESRNRAEIKAPQKGRGERERGTKVEGNRQRHAHGYREGEGRREGRKKEGVADREIGRGIGNRE